MRKIILNLAISLDGYISDDDGGFDWIKGQGDNTSDTKESFDFNEFQKSVDTIVMGSIAYEDCVLSGLDNYDNYQLIVATSRTFDKKDNVKFVNGDICNEILSLKKEKGKDIWLFGGAGLTDAFIRSDVIDQYIVGIIPTILGSGRLLFKGGYNTINLHLDKTYVNDGIAMLVYSKANK